MGPEAGAHERVTLPGAGPEAGALRRKERESPASPLTVLFLRDSLRRILDADIVIYGQGLFLFTWDPGPCGVSRPLRRRPETGIWVSHKGDLHAFMTAPDSDKAPPTSRVSLPAEGTPCVSLGVVAGQALRLLGLQGLDCAPRLVPLPILTAPHFRVREQAHDGLLGSSGEP